jgi:NADH:ubiquinone oxidoreductase subunit E
MLEDTDAMQVAFDIDWHRIDQIIDQYNGDSEALLMIMQDISEIYNYVPPEVLVVVAKKLRIRESLAYSVATFYKGISLEPRGKYIIHVCTGTACHVRGGKVVMEGLQEKLGVKEGQTTDDLLFTLEAVRCLGCCASGPVMRVNQEMYGGLNRSSALKIIDHYIHLNSSSHG